MVGHLLGRRKPASNMAAELCLCLGDSKKNEQPLVERSSAISKALIITFLALTR